MSATETSRFCACESLQRPNDHGSCDHCEKPIMHVHDAILRYCLAHHDGYPGSCDCEARFLATVEA